MKVVFRERSDYYQNWEREIRGATSFRRTVYGPLVGIVSVYGSNEMYSIGLRSTYHELFYSVYALEVGDT